MPGSSFGVIGATGSGYGSPPTSGTPPLVVVSQGSSASSTPGTEMVAIEANSGKHFVDFGGLCRNGENVNSQVTVEVTYTDDTTASYNSDTPAYYWGIFNRAGYLHDLESLDTNTGRFWSTSKQVKKVTVKTLGAGIGTRYAQIYGVEVAI